MSTIWRACEGTDARPRALRGRAARDGIVVPIELSSRFALGFGAQEQFLIAVWGRLIAGTISGEGDSAIEGWISGWLGLGLSMVGLEAIHAYPRITFDGPEMRSGTPGAPIGDSTLSCRA